MHSWSRCIFWGLDSGSKGLWVRGAAALGGGSVAWVAKAPILFHFFEKHA